jgi:hypothetical protein
VGEPLDQWGVPASKTCQFVRDYTWDVVARYRSSPAIWGWQFGNEYNLGADLPNAAEHRPPVVPKLGTPTTRSARDELTSDAIRVAFGEFARQVRRLDGGRIITTGDSIPRRSAWHQRKERSWTADSAGQFAEVLLGNHADPIDAIGVHVYELADLPRLATAVEAAGKAGKPLLVGEFGVPGPPTDKSRREFAELLAAIERSGAPLAALWVYDFAGQKGQWNVTPDNERAWQLDAIAEASARISGGQGAKGPIGPMGPISPIGPGGPQTAPAPAASAAPAVQVYSGMSDASGAVALDANTFLTVDDERNILCAYRRDQSGKPISVIDLDPLLGARSKKGKPPEEADFEGMATLGGKVYLIGSHGRTHTGKWRQSRMCFVAVTVEMKAGVVTVTPFGTVRRDLMTELLADPRTARLGLAAALGSPAAHTEDLAPKKGGLNIEGLGAMADGKGLLIGFRNPLVAGKAILVALTNPAAVVAEGAKPVFGEPILLPLPVWKEGKRIDAGVRSIEWSPRVGAYLISAGPADERKVFAIYKWSGKPSDAPVLLEQATRAVAAVEHFTPEAIIIYPHSDRFQLLSDDGSRRVQVAGADDCLPGEFQAGWTENKSLKDLAKRTFRSLWLEPR